MKLTTPVLVTLSATFTVLVGLAVYLISTGHDPGSYIGTVTTLFALIPGVLGIAVSQKKTDDKVNTIQANTNGNLTKLQSANAAKDAEIQALRSVMTPDQISQVAPVNPVAPATPAAPTVDPVSAAVATLPPESSITVTQLPVSFPATVSVEADAAVANG